MTDEISPDEAVEMMEENWVGETVTRNGKQEGTGNDIRVLSARVENGEPELRVLPIDHNGDGVPTNKHWLHLADFDERYL